MESDPRADRATLAALQARAQEEAERFFGEGVTPAWRTGRQRPRMPLYWRRLLPGTLALAAALALGIAFVGMGRTDEVVAASAAVSSHAALTPTPPPPSRVAAALRPAAPASLQIIRDQDLWRIEAHGADRFAAARELADLNGLPLQGATDLLAATHPLTVTWQGRDASFAWQAVLADEVNFSLECRAGRCQARILSAAPLPARDDAGTPRDSAPGNRPPQEQDEPSNPGAQFH